MSYRNDAYQGFKLALDTAIKKKSFPSNNWPVGILSEISFSEESESLYADRTHQLFNRLQDLFEERSNIEEDQVPIVDLAVELLRKLDSHGSGLTESSQNKVSAYIVQLERHELEQKERELRKASSELEKQVSELDEKVRAFSTNIDSWYEGLEPKRAKAAGALYTAEIRANRNTHRIAAIAWLCSTVLLAAFFVFVSMSLAFEADFLLSVGFGHDGALVQVVPGLSVLAAVAGSATWTSKKYGQARRIEIGYRDLSDRIRIAEQLSTNDGDQHNLNWILAKDSIKKPLYELTEVDPSLLVGIGAQIADKGKTANKSSS